MFLNMKIHTHTHIYKKLHRKFLFIPIRDWINYFNNPRVQNLEFAILAKFDQHRLTLTKTSKIFDKKIQFFDQDKFLFILKIMNFYLK